MTKPVKVYRVTLMIVDHADCGRGEITAVIEHARYPNHCISPFVVGMDEREVEWEDSHPLNQREGWIQAFQNLFGIIPRP